MESHHLTLVPSWDYEWGMLAEGLRRLDDGALGNLPGCRVKRRQKGHSRAKHLGFAHRQWKDSHIPGMEEIHPGSGSPGTYAESTARSTVQFSNGQLTSSPAHQLTSSLNRPGGKEHEKEKGTPCGWWRKAEEGMARTERIRWTVGVGGLSNQSLSASQRD